MNNKLSERLKSFPKDYQLSQETQVKIESILQEEIKKMEKQAKWKGFKGLRKKLTIPVSGITVIARVSLLLLTSENFKLFQTGVDKITGKGREKLPKWISKLLISVSILLLLLPLFLSYHENNFSSASLDQKKTH